MSTYRQPNGLIYKQNDKVDTVIVDAEEELMQLTGPDKPKRVFWDDEN